MDRTPVWLDCDPGHDDAFAIILAGHSPRLELLGISTVSGNLPVATTTANALRVCDAAGLSAIPIVEGAARPLVRPPVYCESIHGESGLDALGAAHLPPPGFDRCPVKAKAITFMFETIHARAAACAPPLPGERGGVVLIATGALTNVALLLRVYPEVAADLREIVLMGGALGRGNTGPVAEFNIQVDPDAAAIVFAAGIPLTMVPLEVTHTALVTPAILRRVATGCDAAGAAAADSAVTSDGASDSVVATSRLRGVLVGLLRFFASTYNTVFGMPDPPLHDPVAVAYVIDPGLFTARRYKVDIETASPFSYGQTVVDTFNLSGHPESSKNANVTLAVRVDGFWDVMLAAVAAADVCSPLNR